LKIENIMDIKYTFPVYESVYTGIKLMAIEHELETNKIVFSFKDTRLGKMFRHVIKKQIDCDKILEEHDRVWKMRALLLNIPVKESIMRGNRGSAKRPVYAMFDNKQKF